MIQHLERLDSIAIFLQKPALGFIAQCDATLHRKLLVVYGWRGVGVQRGLYAQGRQEISPGLWRIIDAAKVVTNARVSPHNVITRAGAPASVAFDVIPLHPDGTIDWEPGEAFWSALYPIAWDYGLDPLGDQVGAYLKSDKGHFEEPGWKLKLDGLGLILPEEG